jgi:hypothetical protein
MTRCQILRESSQQRSQVPRIVLAAERELIARLPNELAANVAEANAARLYRV